MVVCLSFNVGTCDDYCRFTARVLGNVSNRATPLAVVSPINGLGSSDCPGFLIGVAGYTGIGSVPWFIPCEEVPHSSTQFYWRQ